MTEEQGVAAVMDGSIRRLVWTINAVAALKEGSAIAARAGARIPGASP